MSKSRCITNCYIRSAQLLAPSPPPTGTSPWETLAGGSRLSGQLQADVGILNLQTGDAMYDAWDGCEMWAEHCVARVQDGVSIAVAVGNEPRGLVTPAADVWVIRIVGKPRDGGLV